MAENSNISWCTHTINFWIGCTKISPACDGCYAEFLMDTRMGKVKWGGERVRTSASTWKTPFKWNREALRQGTRPFVFASSLSDIFDNQVPTQWRTDAFDVMRRTPHLIYLLLTKRPQNIVKLSKDSGGLPLNAAIGTTVEDQKRAEINIPWLLDAKAALQPLFAFLSCEPLLGPIDIMPWCNMVPEPHSMIDWVITGGETDQGQHKARPTHPNLFRQIRDQCSFANIPYHHKQNGEWVSVSEISGPGELFKFDDEAVVRKVGRGLAGRTLDGVIHNGFPKAFTGV